MSDKITDKDLPEGFKGKASGEVKYKEISNENKQQQGVNFGRRRGGMGMVVEKPKEAAKTIPRLIKYFKEEKRLLYALIAVIIISTICSLITPAMQGEAIDIIANKTGMISPVCTVTLFTWKKLIVLLIKLLLLYFLYAGTMLAQMLLSAHLSQRIVKKMRGDLFRKICHLPIKYLDTHSNGDIMSRMTNDVENISNTVSQSLGSLISGVLTIIGTIAIMFWYCTELTLITMVTVVITVVVTKSLSKVMKRVFKMRSEVLGSLNGHSEEMITGYKSIVAYNKQEDVINEFNAVSDRLTKVGIKAEILGSCMGPVMNCISNIGFVIVAAFGGYFAYKGIITIGTISAFIIYAKQFSRPINEIAQLYGMLQTAIAGAERVFELIDQPDEDNSGERLMSEIDGNIVFENVNFSYNEDKQVLYNFNLNIQKGEKVALVGATGSGKTTVVNLLMRFYNIDSGKILIDGVDIMDMKRDELRKNIAIVLQDTVLFSDTIERNIKYANEEADEEEMLSAARMSNCSFFIEKLPEKYKTFLKQAGANLSQGQRQLINIARAVLANPKILILDEATSSVDTRTEKNIQDAMQKLMENRTSLIIAHRLSTIQDADKIVVMDKGHVVEIGNHEELLEAKGRYYALYMTQFAGNEI